MSDPRQALDAIVLALDERLGHGVTREILDSAVELALHPPCTDSTRESWHTADVAFHHGAHLLAQELLDAIDRRAVDTRVAQACAKTRRAP